MAAKDGELERIVSIIAGVWLLSSAFVWAHTPFQRANAIVCGILAVAFSVFDIYFVRLRALSALLAVWIFASALIFRSSPHATLWSNTICAAAILVGLLAGGPKRALA